jgi:hypothetical protein
VGGLAVSAACRFDAPQAGPADAQAVDASPADAGADAARPSCLDRWHRGDVAFRPPVHLGTLLSPQEDRDPVISPDELTLHFASRRWGGARVLRATRATPSAPFPLAVDAIELNADGADTTRVTSTPDQLIVVISSRRAGSTGGSDDLFLATRAAPTAALSAFSTAQTGAINSDQLEVDPEISSDGLRLYLAKGNTQRIALASRSAVGLPFGAAALVSGLASQPGRGDADPALSADERVLVFSSRRDTGNGPPDDDSNLWFTVRADRSAAFAVPKLVPHVSSTADDGDPALSADGCRLYFASSRPVGAPPIDANFELWVAELTP